MIRGSEAREAKSSWASNNQNNLSSTSAKSPVSQKRTSRISMKIKSWKSSNKRA
jgi:hypothetical protein